MSTLYIFWKRQRLEYIIIGEAIYVTSLTRGTNNTGFFSGNSGNCSSCFKQILEIYLDMLV